TSTGRRRVRRWCGCGGSGGGGVRRCRCGSRPESTTVYNLTVDGLHTYYVGGRDAAVLAHNSNPLECPLRAYTDLKRMGPGKNEGVTSVLWTPSGNRYFDFSRNRTPAQLRELPLVIRRVIGQVGHHGGCAEIGCITQALEAGDLIKGSQSLAMVHKPFNNLQNRRLLPGCESCQNVMSRLGIRDTF
ncbi:hypothetical protein ACIQ7D_37460, partial [Streptomyces sp. NPDC096310]|uniref:hypothetical protein n=1 Tax=Streptomyces sp. NPDC096310 TaxID=3366082 RepID=UPI0037FA098D